MAYLHEIVPLRISIYQYIVPKGLAIISRSSFYLNLRPDGTQGALQVQTSERRYFYSLALVVAGGCRSSAKETYGASASSDTFNPTAKTRRGTGC